jgi:hypothetical protein
LRLRELTKCNNVNDGNRTLFESILIPEVEQAAKDWESNSNCNAVLIGGLALSYYVKPRTTTDADFLFMSSNQIPEIVSGFKRHRSLTFEHRNTGVEIEVLSPEAINMPIELAQDIFKTSERHGKLNVASREGLIAAKLLRFSLQDEADVDSLLKLGPVDMSEFHLSQKSLENYQIEINR